MWPSASKGAICLMQELGEQTGDDLVSPYRRLVFAMSPVLDTPEPDVLTSIMPPQWSGV
jgi:hypothetical protein